MNDAGNALIALLKKAVRGEQADEQTLPDPDAARRVFRLADLHSVLPLALEPVLLSEKLKDCAEKNVVGNARSRVLIQTRRTADLLLLLDFLEARELRPVIMKGIICRELYPVPSLRPSVDEDFLIPPDRIAAYDAALKEYGFETETDVSELEKNDEITYCSKDLGMCIEVHRYPFPTGKRAYAHLNRWLDGAQDRAKCTVCQGRRILTLDETDHLLYMLFHVYKHFLHGGFGIRQVCDIALFSERNAGVIDWEALRRSCAEAGIYRFCAAVYGVCARLLGDSPLFSVLDADVLSETDCSPLLEDIMDSGVYGTTTMSRMHSSTLTLHAAEMARSGRKARVNPIASLFPPLDYMKNGYPFLKKAPFLLPVAWAKRFFGYLREKKIRKHGNSARESVELGRRRIELMKFYGIAGS